jgi:hypothetical protein
MISAAWNAFARPGETMKSSLAVLIFTMCLSACAQSADAIYAQACGPKDASFDVQQVKGQPPAVPEPGKALVYFIQKESGAPFTTRVGLDGAWVGVIKEDSYISVSVAPGEHHGCAATQNRKHPEAELVHFTAKAGKVYYYLVRGIATGGNCCTPDTMEFSLADHDEALYLIASDLPSVAKPKP